MKGLYSAVSGAMAQSSKMDTIANNMANVNTPGFKRDQQLFQEYVTRHEKEPSVMPIPRDVAAIESFYDMQGLDKSYVDAAGTFTEHTQGSLKHTGNALDVAIDGSGFFEVMTPQGVRLTRAGHFTLDGNGQLVTQEGFPVLKKGEAGEDPSSRVFMIPPTQSLSISDQGEISAGTENLGFLSLVDIKNKESLLKQGNNLYDFKKNHVPEITELGAPSVRQGFIETSNINIVQEMTDMIQTQRVFESNQKAISAYDSMMDKVVNVVPSTRAT